MKILILLILLIIISAIVSAAEAALLSFKNIDLEKIGKTNPRVYSALKYWLKNPNDILSTILITNNATSILVSSITTSLLLHYHSKNMAVVFGTLLSTIVVLVFGEITPKLIAKSYSSTISKRFIVPIMFMSKILYPFIFVLTHISKLFSRLLGLTIVGNEITVTEKDIRALISYGEQEGVIGRDKREMLDSIFHFNELTAGDLVVPRQNVYMLKADQKVQDCLQEIIDRGFSRVPLYEHDIDNVVGAIYMKDLILLAKSDRLNEPLKNFMRDIYFIPETKSAFNLLKEFREKKTHIAAVVDEYGGNVGIITIEDIIEVIVGDIKDEFDKEQIDIKKMEDDKYLIRGDIDIEEINDETGFNIPESEDYESLGGFIVFSLGHLPQKGETLDWNNLHIFIKDVNNHAVKYAIVEKKD